MKKRARGHERLEHKEAGKQLFPPHRTKVTWKKAMHMKKTHNKRGKVRERLEATEEEREEKQKPLTAPSQRLKG